MKDDLISRQAAIETVKKHYRVDNDLLEVIAYEIEALPPAQLAQDLPNGCTDTISRAAVGDALNRIEISRNASWYEFYQKALTAVGTLPSAQTERKKGKWIERNPRNSPDCRLIECSECGNAYIVGYNINYDDWINGRNFCMKCGADLRGGSNGKST